jgi:2'-5' RNA ligase
MARLRTFIAVDFGKTIRDRAVALQEKLAQSGAAIKWVEAENLHVTMLFLGEVDDRDVPAVCTAVADCCRGRPPFALTIQALGCFPHARRPRILWIGVTEGAQELVALHDALEPPLLDLGCYRREERRYTPHVTLGRVKNDRSADKLAEALAKHADWRGGEIVVREVLVMSSELTSDGPQYTVLSRAKMGSG